jgi:hypothetical protein
MVDRMHALAQRRRGERIVFAVAAVFIVAGVWLYVRNYDTAPVPTATNGSGTRLEPRPTPMYPFLPELPVKTRL